ncbi:cytochrome C [Stieleria sp. TO1_6]|nr:cytochrome C [Stieleria tagensis]
MTILMRFQTVWILAAVVAVGTFSVGQATGQDSAQERRAVDDEGHLVDFQRDIVPIFRVHCLECHNEQEAKNDFRIDDPDAVFSYVEPEDIESSTLFVEYLLSEDPDFLMPPPSHGGPLTPAELALVRVWIEEGASWPEGTQFDAGDHADLAVPQEVPPEPKTLLQRVWTFQGFFHPATVHFPIALFLLGAVFVVLGWKWPALGKQVPLACLLIGAPTALASTMMGWAFAADQGYGSWSKVDFDSELFWHRWSGVIVAGTSVVLAVIALIGLRGRSDRLDRVWKIGLLALAGMVGAVGHQGGELSFGKDFYPRAFRILLGNEEQPADPPPVDGHEVVAEAHPVE